MPLVMAHFGGIDTELLVFDGSYTYVHGCQRSEIITSNKVRRLHEPPVIGLLYTTIQQ